MVDATKYKTKTKQPCKKTTKMKLNLGSRAFCAIRAGIRSNLFVQLAGHAKSWKIVTSIYTRPGCVIMYWGTML